MKISKKEAKAPDSFISFADKAGQALHGRWKNIMTVAGVALLVGVGIVATNQYNKHIEESAQEALFTIENELLKKQQAEQKASEEAEVDKADGKTNNKKQAAEEAKTPEVLNAKYGEIVSRYKTVIDKHKSTTAAQMAAVGLADLHREYNDLDGARSALEPVASQANSNDLLFGLVNVQLSHVLVKLGQSEAALKHLQSVLDSKAQEYLHADVILKMGLVFEKMNQMDKAKGMYERVSEDFSSSSAAQAAKGYLRLIQLQQADNKESADQEG